MLADFLGFVAALIGLAELNQEIRIAIEFLRERGGEIADRFHDWYHHNLAARVRPFFGWSMIIQFVAIMAALAWVFFMVPGREGFWPLAIASLPIFLIVSILPLNSVRRRLRGVRPVDFAHLREVVEWEAEIERITAENEGRAVRNRTLLAIPAPPDSPLTPQEMLVAYGPGGRFQIARSLVFLVGSFLATALWLFIMAGILYTRYDTAWKYPAVIGLLAVIPGFVGFCAWVLTAMVLGRTLTSGGGIFNRLLNVLLRPVLIALPGITDENYDKVMPTPLELPFTSVGEFMQHLHVMPFVGVTLAGACMLLWPNLWIELSVLVMLVVGLFLDYAQTRGAKIDTQEARKRMFRGSAVILFLLGLARVVQMVIETNSAFFTKAVNKLIDTINAVGGAKWYYLIIVFCLAFLAMGIVRLAKPKKEGFALRVWQTLQGLSLLTTLVVIVVWMFMAVGHPFHFEHIDASQFRMDIPQPRVKVLPSTPTAVRFQWDDKRAHRIERQAQGETEFKSLPGAENIPKDVTNWELRDPLLVHGEDLYRVRSLGEDDVPSEESLNGVRITLVSSPTVRIEWDPLPEAVGTRIMRRFHSDPALTTLRGAESLGRGVATFEDHPDQLGEYFYCLVALYPKGLESNPSWESRAIFVEQRQQVAGKEEEKPKSNGNGNGKSNGNSTPPPPAGGPSVASSNPRSNLKPCSPLLGEEHIKTWRSNGWCL